MDRKLGRILIVEDDPVSRRTLARLLVELGYIVETADSVAAAATHLADPPHCLLLDMYLPDGWGSEVARTAKAVRPGVRIAYITGSVLRGQLPFAADEMFVKPVLFSDVLTWVQRSCNADRNGPLAGAAPPAHVGDDN